MTSASTTIEQIVKMENALTRRVTPATIEVNKFKRIAARETFNNYPQVIPCRTHGWTTAQERQCIAFFKQNGICVGKIANKFAIAIPTVYAHSRGNWAVVRD